MSARYSYQPKNPLTDPSSMLVTEAQAILDHLKSLGDQSVANRKLFFLVIEGVIGGIERYGNEVDSALAGNTEAVDFHRRMLWDLLRELEQLSLEDPFLMDRIGLIHLAFSAAFQRACADVAARKGSEVIRPELAWMTLSADASPPQPSGWARKPRL